MPNIKEITIFHRNHLYDLLWTKATNSHANLELDKAIARLVATMEKEDVAYVKEQVTNMLASL